jgi:hypothetical protein
VGLGDVFKGLFSRRDAPVEPLVLLRGEDELARVVSTWRTGTLANIDGYLILTTQRLVLASDESGDTIAVLTWWLHASYARHEVPTSAILAAAEVGADSSLISPPTLVLVDTTGHPVEVGILASRLTPNLSQANAAARDRMVAAIRSTVPPAPVRRPPPQRPPGQDPFSWFPDS